MTSNRLFRAEVPHGLTRCCLPNRRLVRSSEKTRTARVLVEALLFPNKNQNSRCQRQDAHDDRRDSDVEQQSDS